MLLPIVEARSLSYEYLTGRRGLHNFSCTVEPGEFIQVSGPSGCGKTTLLRCFSGLIPHLYKGRLTGEVCINGERTADIPMHRLCRMVATVLQNPASQLFTDTVAGEIRYGLVHCGISTGEQKQRFDAITDMMQLQHLLDRNPAWLSGGEQQLVLLACMLARQPRMLLLDEPLSMLDHAHEQCLVGYLSRCSKAGTAVVVMEHRSHLLSDVITRRIAMGGGTEEEATALKTFAYPPAPVTVTVDLKNVSAVVDKRNVLHDISGTFSGGEIIVLTGPNGAGKTTLLRLLAGLQKYQGTMGVNGTKNLPVSALVFQNPDLQFFNPDVKRELLFGRGDENNAVFEAIVDYFDLNHLLHRSPLLLSEGEKKRCSIAIALMCRPDHLFLFDEPTSGQDERNKRLLGNLLSKLAQEGYCCIVSTHDLFWARKYATRMIALDKGRITEDSPVGRQKEEPFVE